MGLIMKPLEIVGDKGRAWVMASFDTGASSSFIRKDIAEQVASFGPLLAPRRFMLGDGKNSILAQDFVALDITIQGVTVYFSALSCRRDRRGDDRRGGYAPALEDPAGPREGRHLHRSQGHRIEIDDLQTGQA